MLTLISPQQYRKIPWKNGLGHTLELAISPDGNINEFDWRLSIATVAQEGAFSNFSGYARKLVLIAGQGMSLTHDHSKTDHLEELLQFSCFDGGAHTESSLHNGAIDDFNVMVNKSRYEADVLTFNQVKEFNFSVDELAFIYPLCSNTELNHPSFNEQLLIPPHHLMMISSEGKTGIERPFCLSGNMVLIIKLKRIALNIEKAKHRS